VNGREKEKGRGRGCLGDQTFNGASCAASAPVLLIITIATFVRWNISASKG